MMMMTHCQDHILTKQIGLYGLKRHTVEINRDVTRQDGRTNTQTREDSATHYSAFAVRRLSFAIMSFREEIHLDNSKKVSSGLFVRQGV